MPCIKLPFLLSSIRSNHRPFRPHSLRSTAARARRWRLTPRALSNNHRLMLGKLGFREFRSRAMLGCDKVHSKPVMYLLPDDDGSNRRCRKQDLAPQVKLLTLPTVLTIGRVAAVPLLVCTFYSNSSWATTATTSIFIVASITDWLDGYLARKLKLGSAFGAFLDPVADKLMVAATLVLLCTRPPEVAIFGQFPWLLAIPSITIIGREITMSAVREWAASQNSELSEAVAVNNLGKWKTATQMAALTILLVTRDSSLVGVGVLVASGVALLHISSWLAVWSLYVYMKKIWKVLLM